MADHRHKDKNWMITDDRETRAVNSWPQVHAALLMDLRDELKRLNALLHCLNFVSIPQTLRKIAKNTTKPRKRKARKT